MAGIAKRCLQSCMKALNIIMGMVGVSMIFYSFWMIRVWQRDLADHHFHSSAPWFIFTFLGTGVTFCLITCLGHIAAHTANSFCLYCYMSIICLVLLVETAIAADVTLNSDWEKDVPEDPTGRLDGFKDFVESNIDIFRWIGLLIILAQGTSILLGTVLRSLGQNHGSYDSDDDDYRPARLPLINHKAQPPAYVIGQPGVAVKSDPVKSPAIGFAWNANK